MVHRPLLLGAVLLLAATVATAAPVHSSSRGDPPADCAEKIKEYKRELDAATANLAQANKAFNTTLASEQQKVARAVQAQQAAFNAYASQQDLANNLQNTYNTDQDHFMDAVNEMQRLVALCSTPQPPANCADQLRAASASVASNNSTLAATKSAWDQARATLAQDADQRDTATATYNEAIKHQSDALSRAQQTMAGCKSQVDEATERWNNESIACAPGRR